MYLFKTNAVGSRLQSRLLWQLVQEGARYFCVLVVGQSYDVSVPLSACWSIRSFVLGDGHGESVLGHGLGVMCVWLTFLPLLPCSISMSFWRA